MKTPENDSSFPCDVEGFSTIYFGLQQIQKQNARNGEAISTVGRSLKSATCISKRVIATTAAANTLRLRATQALNG